MDKLNNTPVQIEAQFRSFRFVSAPPFWRMSEIGAGCMRCAELSWEGNSTVKFCIEAKGPYEPVPTPWPLESGEKIILVGRESWAGIVIDEIRRAPDQSLQQTSAGEAPQVRGPRRMQ